MILLARWLLVVSVCASAFSACVADAPVQYTVAIDAPHTHYVQVEAKIIPKQAGDVDLFMPVWTPGSYLVREYARQVDSFTAVTSDGKPLKWSKTNKNHWKVFGAPVEGVTVRYRVYCNELSVRTNFVDSEFAILAPAATFMTSQQLIGDEHLVQLRLPGAWKQSLTALEHPIAAAAHSYRAANFDELVDSPIFMGNPQVHPFRVGDVEHFLVNQGGDPYWNGEAAAADVAKIVAQHQKMWGVVPYKRYYFFNIIAESGGGLEHNNSTVLLTSRWAFRNPKNYKKWLGMVSHEFFHTWNVRRLRPRALSRYDYESEVYFDELWVAEGITSYYDELALVRAGLNTSSDYMAVLSKQIETVQGGPGRLKQSLAESSRDAWIKFYRPDENSANTSINYYVKGAVVGFLLDAQIRARTANQKSLDDCMRLLYQRHAERDGFTNADVVQTASELVGSDMQAWFTKAIDSTEELDYSEALSWLGLAFQASKPDEKQEGAKATPVVPLSAAPAEVWTGLTLDAKWVVTKITESSPAFDAGLNVGDELIAIDGFRLNETLEERVKQYKAGESIKVLLSRRGRLMEVSLQLVARSPASWRLELIKAPTAAQRQSFSSWLK